MVWKGPTINKKMFIGLKTPKLSKKIQILPIFLGYSFNGSPLLVRSLMFKLGVFFLTRKKVWHKK